MNYTYTELAELAKQYKPTKEEIEELRSKLETQKDMWEESERKSRSQEFLNRTYNL